MKAVVFISIFLLTVTLTVSATESNARRLTNNEIQCRLFYSSSHLVTSITRHDPENPSRPELQVLQSVLAQHYNKHEINLTTTVEAFTSFLDIIDPYKVLISAADFEKLGYPSDSFFIHLHKNLTSPKKSDVHSELLIQALDRLEIGIERFSKDSTFRQKVRQRALSLEVAESAVRAQTNQELEENTIRYLGAQWKQNGITDFIKIIKSDIQTYRSQVSSRDLSELITQSYLKTFDSHSDLYMNPNRLQNRGALGIMTQSVRPGLQIVKLDANGPGARAGLLKDDIIVAVKESDVPDAMWISTLTKSIEEARILVSGAPQTRAQLRIRRGTDLLEISVERKSMTTAERALGPSEYYEGRSGPVASIPLLRFSDGVAKKVRERINQLIYENKARGLVLDLRGNPGGSAAEMAEILGMFVAVGPAVIFKNQNSQFAIPIPDGSPIWHGPLVILVNEQSASSSEALASALQDYKRGIVVGSVHTRGKGSSQITASRYFRYKYTDGLFFSPLGQSIQWRGVISDIPLLNRPPDRHYEKYLANSLHPETIDTTTLQPLALASYDLDKKIQSLKFNSVARLQKYKTDALEEQRDGLNLQEAFRILDDWVALQFISG